jgi:hypothetical protein
MAKKTKGQLEIKVPLPKDKIKKYLESFRITSPSEAEESQLQALFIKTIDDFIKGELCLDEFSSISNYLWWEGGIMPKREKTNKEFYDTLQLAGELSFYVRGKSNEVRESALWVLNRVFDYYERYSKK